MGSRLRPRKSIKRLFECYLIIDSPPCPSNGHSSPSSSSNGQSTSSSPTIRSVYPSTFSSPSILKAASEFCFPCPLLSSNVELFTFVLTSEDSKWTFGYCRHPQGPSSSKTCILFLTFLPWQEIFYRALNFLAEITDPSKLATFLERMYSTPIPEPGTCLYIPTHTKPFICSIPSEHSLPSIPENRNVSEFYNALTTESMLVLFAALLSERRIVITSKKISRLSSLCVASNLFLFPMSWQHIFIPVVTVQLQDYLSAPMPFLMGVPLPIWNLIPGENLGQLVHVDADSDTVTTPFPEDLEQLPEDVVYLLRKNLTGERVLGDGLARAFLRALAQLMGHYQDAVRNESGDVAFDSELFLQFAHPSHRPFIEKKLLKLQIFQQFMEERVDRIKSGNCESDEFELESLAWRSSRANGKNGLRVLGGLTKNQNRTAIKKAGKAVIMSVKRESEKAIESVKQNSALKSAVRSIKESGKSVKQKGHVAYSDIRSKFHVSHHHMPGTSRNLNAIDYALGGGTSSATGKDYRRQGTTSSLVVPPLTNQMLDGHHLSASTTSHQFYLRSSDDSTLVLSGSLSASKMNELDLEEKDLAAQRRQPRLSKSEENLIDLDTPTGLSCFDDLEEEWGVEGEGLGFTLENPLYEMLTDNNNVFLEEDDGTSTNHVNVTSNVTSSTSKTDAELLSEYGLDQYFAQMNFSSSSSTGTGAGSGGALDPFTVSDPFSPPPPPLPQSEPPSKNGLMITLKSPSKSGTPQKSPNSAKMAVGGEMLTNGFYPQKVKEATLQSKINRKHLHN